VDGAYKHRALRRKGGEVAAEISLRCAVASASLESISGYLVEDVRSGKVLDPVVHGALRVAEALPALAERWQTAPRQVLAKLHMLAGAGVLPGDAQGRPLVQLGRSGLAGWIPGAPASLDLVSEIVVAKLGDPLVRAAVVHGELLALAPFPGVNGIVARAAGRLTLVASGLDPRGLVATEEVHLEREPEYRGAAGAFATGTPDGMRSWLRHVALAVSVGAERIAPIGDTVLAEGWRR
jgi:hypothetical protein